MAQVSKLLDMLKEYQYLKKKLNNRRLDYDAKFNKLQKSKREKPQLEEEVKITRLKYEETTQDLENLMVIIEEREKEMAGSLFDFIEAQSEYFEKTCESLRAGKEGLFGGKRPKTENNNGSASLPRVWSRDSIEERPKESKPPISAFKARALYDFTPSNKDELCLKKGDVLTVYDEFDDGWWTGCNEKDDLGMFPSNYVEKLEDVESTESESNEDIGEITNSMDKTTVDITNEVSSETSQDERMLHELHDHLSKPKEVFKQFEIPERMETTSIEKAVCAICGCKEFCANVFKADSCNNCFHKHE